MFCERKKNLSVRRKIFKVWKGEKNVSVGFRVFGKNGNWKKSSGKKIRVFWVEILLSSCSLVNLQVKVMGKKMLKIFRVCSGWVFEVKFAICLGILKLKKWNLNLSEKKCFVNFKEKFVGVGYPVSWAPCCEWNESWVLCCERTWSILSRTLGESFTCVYTRGPWAVEYLARLSRILKIFLKSFKAMILGFDFI